MDKASKYVQKVSSVPVAHWDVPYALGAQNSSKFTMHETPGKLEAGGLNLQSGMSWEQWQPAEAMHSI